MKREQIYPAFQCPCGGKDIIMGKNRTGSRIKRFAFLSIVIVLAGIFISASAGWWYVKTPNGKTVNIRDYDSGEVIGQIPYGTRVYANEDSTETSAYVTYNGVEGFVKWEFLTKDKPEPYQGKTTSASKSTSKPKPTETPGIYGDGPYTVSVTGGVLQFPNKKGKAAGTKYIGVRYEEPTALVVTAVVPKGKKIDYWIVNNVKMRLSDKSFSLTAEEQDITVEIIFK